MKFKNKIKEVCLALLLFCNFAPAQADIITLDSGWNSFAFSGVGSPWGQTFEFTITDTAWFAVTDAFLSGDRFEFFLDGVSLGLTSMPTTQGDIIFDNYDSAFGDARWSSAEVMLGAGTYQVTGTTILSPYGSGGAAVQLSSTSLGGPTFANVSEPALPLLLGIALTSLFIRARKRNNR
ncbi:hypothetical protein [Alteromonas ponticola]|uniref:PEP-CTERM sorting domain-containing protein n=1 Tax=Alteromonas ponticola TaxID=2720613 RepID=A0ABX1R2A0_9ALTE|nr:hypothetical protein [Alteromonas ponticola]NMH60587.1 hypothetical protein [Alteromonas ponticola]